MGENKVNRSISPEEQKEFLNGKNFQPIARYNDLIRYVKRLCDCVRVVNPHTVNAEEDNKKRRREAYEELSMAWAEIGKVALELEIAEFGLKIENAL